MTNENLTYEEKLAKEVERDFLERQTARKNLERGWQININFVNGKQYCGVDAKGEIFEEEKDYYWQDKRVFNHIAPIVDVRLSKLSHVRPALVVRAASEDEQDKKSAALSSAILAAVKEDCDLDGAMNAAAAWSEICGTAFYKVVWNDDGGREIGVTADGKRVCEGAVGVAALSPFEIYPYSLAIENVDDQPSIIHARALPISEINYLYGIELAPRKEGDSQLSVGDWCGNMPDFCENSEKFELVLERYEKPCAECPDGRLTVVAGGELLFDGVLPYVNGENGSRGYPFVKQTSLAQPGSFFGTSVVDRLIPLQRAFNAVKNRKHEFLNRISMGTVAIEDGSVDLDDFSQGGLAPGQIIVYRQGAKPPEMLTLGSVPAEFGKEEDSLLEEFGKVSGTGDLSENADSFAGITSATGLQLILDQSEQRLSLTYGSVKRAVKQIGRHILRLYRQFTGEVRLMRYAGANGETSVAAFKGSDIASDDVTIEADSDQNMTTAQKRTVLYEMIDRGLFLDDNGKISPSNRRKIFETLGYQGFAEGKDLTALNVAKAEAENSAMLTGSAEVKDYDDHGVHINEHVAYLLAGNVEKNAERRICAHIEQHKKKLNYNLSEDKNG